MNKPIKGYKVFDEDWKCRDFQYEIGQTYTYKGDLVLCQCGFHFCEKAVDCFSYKSFDTRNKCAEVEALGKVLRASDKCVTDKIRIVREITWKELLELCNTGRSNMGLRNSGDFNCGDDNTAHCNTGDHNSGIRNYGGYNTGNSNEGNYNSGCSNRGSHNSGQYNVGYYNSGDRNIGHYNSGDWNLADYNSGFLNTTDPPLRIFDKETDVPRSSVVFPRFFFFSTSVWISARKMTKQEKQANPSWKTVGGCCRVYTPKEAWRMAFEDARSRSDWEAEKKKLLSLPNFDFDKFEQISGISKKDILGTE